MNEGGKRERIVVSMEPYFVQLEFTEYHTHFSFRLEDPVHISFSTARD